MAEAEYGCIADQNGQLDIAKLLPTRAKSNFHGRNEMIAYVSDSQKGASSNKANNIKKIRAL